MRRGRRADRRLLSESQACPPLVPCSVALVSLTHHGSSHEVCDEIRDEVEVHEEVHQAVDEGQGHEEEGREQDCKGQVRQGGSVQGRQGEDGYPADQD